MFAAVGLQVVSVIFLGLAAGLIFDWTSAKFFVLGGMAAVIPNALFALRLALQRGRTPESYPAVFFLGEFAKIGLTAALIVWVARSFESVRWLALLIGLIAALQVPIFALLWQRDAPGPVDDAAGVPGQGLPENDATVGGRR